MREHVLEERKKVLPMSLERVAAALRSIRGLRDLIRRGNSPVRVLSSLTEERIE
jgi:hypothetical protein